MTRAPRDIDRRRWRRSLIDHLDDLPRQLAALDASVEAFGEDFDVDVFKAAFETDEPHRYNDVQAVERAFARVQSYLARLADDGTKLAELERRTPGPGEPRAQPWFEALRDEGVLTKELCRRLIQGQRDRNLLEHDYVRVDPCDIHAAVERLRRTAPDFAKRFAAWVAPSLESA